MASKRAKGQQVKIKYTADTGGVSVETRKMAREHSTTLKGMLEDVRNNAGGWSALKANIVTFQAGLGILREAWGAVRNAASGALNLVREAATERTEILRMAHAVRQAGLEWETFEANLASFTEQQRQTTRYGEDDIRALFSTLVQGTSTLELGWGRLSAAAELSLDLMESRGMDAASAAQLVAQVLGGNLRGLGALIGGARGEMMELAAETGTWQGRSAVGWEALSEFVGGYRTRIDETDRSIQQAENSLEEMREAAGNAIEAGISGFADMTGEVGYYTDAVLEAAEANRILAAYAADLWQQEQEAAEARAAAERRGSLPGGGIDTSGLSLFETPEERADRRRRNPELWDDDEEPEPDRNRGSRDAEAIKDAAEAARIKGEIFQQEMDRAALAREMADEAAQIREDTIKGETELLEFLRQVEGEKIALLAQQSSAELAAAEVTRQAQQQEMLALLGMAESWANAVNAVTGEIVDAATLKAMFFGAEAIGLAVMGDFWGAAKAAASAIQYTAAAAWGASKSSSKGGSGSGGSSRVHAPNAMANATASSEAKQPLSITYQIGAYFDRDNARRTVADFVVEAEANGELRRR